MIYRTQLNDTDDAAERAQIGILRNLGPRGRAKMASRLTARNWDAMQRALRRAHPDWSEQQLRVEWVRVQYGEELACKYAASLEKSDVS